MKRYFSVAMLIVGAMVGAGFASGKEIFSFFGQDASPFVAVLCGVLIFLLCILFLKIGSALNFDNIGDVNRVMTGKLHLIVDIFLLVNSFIVLGGMLSAMDVLGNIVLKVSPLYSLVSGLLCFFVVIKGVRGLLECNKLITPIIIILLVLICGLFINKNGTASASTDFTFRQTYMSVIYICMNMMLACTVLTTIGKLSTKQIVVSSFIAAFFLSVLIFLLIRACSGTGYSSSDMPLLLLAASLGKGVFALALIAIAASIFTTMLAAMSGLCGWFSTVFGGKIFSCFVVLLAALALANVGFSNVVTYLYPLIGVLGLIYTLLGIIFMFKNSVLAEPSAKLFQHRNRTIHKGGKYAQNKR